LGEESANFQNSRYLDSPKFLFVAHAIGSWVVKNALARYDNLRLSLETAGVVFLDIGNHDHASFDYSSYLKTLSRGLLLQEAAVIVSRADLGNRLREIDENWQNLELSKSKYVKKYEVMSMKSLLDGLQLVNHPINF
jgi:hypothetical protein